MNIKDISFAIVGGDLRQIYLANNMAKEGYSVKVFGFDNLQDIKFESNVKTGKTISDTIRDADVIIGPIPCTNDNKTFIAKYSSEIITIEEVFENIGENKLFVAGKITEDIIKISNQYNFEIIDLLKREELAIMNAIPTAEGTIQVAMENSSVVLHGSKSLVLGFGRCSKVLVNMLKGLGANVTVCARRLNDLAYIKAYGYKQLKFKDLKNELHKYKFIFNTIPALILDELALEKVDKKSLIVDIASSPGGVDFKKAEELGIKAILALSLPGKVAPETAANIIKETIENILTYV